MKLYTYFRSSAAFRVRIALNLKGIAYGPVFVNLLAGEQKGADYRARNPQALVPSLETEAGDILTQSIAIIEYLNETHPEPRLLPEDPLARARVRAMANIIAADIHPIDNLRVLKYLKNVLGHGQDEIDSWYRHWISEGFKALEKLAEGAGEEGSFCIGSEVTLADVCLVPQMWNARRFETDLKPFPTLVMIDAHLRQLPAFRDAAPENQPDFPDA